MDNKLIMEQQQGDCGETETGRLYLFEYFIEMCNKQNGSASSDWRRNQGVWK